MATPPAENNNTPNAGLRALLGIKEQSEEMTEKVLDAIEDAVLAFIGGPTKEQRQEEEKKDRSIAMNLQKSLLKGLDKVTDAINGIKVGRDGILDDVVAILGVGLLGSLTASITGFFKGIFSLKIFTNFFNVLKNIVNSIRAMNFGRVTKVFSKIAASFTKIGPLVTKIFSSVKSGGVAVVGIVKRIAGFFGRFGKILKPILGLMSKVKGFLKFIPFLGQVIVLIEGIVGFFRGFLGEEGSFFDKLVNGIQGMFAQILEGLSFGFIKFDDVMAFFDKAVDKMSGFFTHMFVFYDENLAPLVDSVFDKISGFFTDTMPKLFEFIKGRFMTAKDAMIKVFETIRNVISSPVNFIKGVFETISLKFGLLLANVSAFLNSIKLPKINLGVAGSIGGGYLLGDKQSDRRAKANVKRLEREYAALEESQRKERERQKRPVKTPQPQPIVVTNNSAVNTSTFATGPENAGEPDPHRLVGT